MTSTFQMSIAEALARLPGPDPEDRAYNILLKRGTAELIVYAPKGVDNQEVHDRDEFYFVTSGSGKFFDGTTTREVKTGDSIFVAAGVEHRFVDFTDELTMWVLFYGLEGGEKA